MRKTREAKPATCPKCGSQDAVIPIGYGYPSSEMSEAAERGEIQLGGCCIGDIDPRFACRRCHIRFDFTRPELTRGKVAERGWIEDSEGTEQCVSD